MSYRRSLLSFLMAAAICGALYFLYHAVDRYGAGRIAGLIGTLPVARLAAAAAFAAASYLCLAGFDYFGVRYAGKPLPYRKTLLASFVGLSIGHNVGVAGLSSGAVRYHFYARSGLTLADVAKVIVFSGVCVACGLSTIAGVGILLQPAQARALVEVDRSVMFFVGWLCVALPWAYVLMTVLLRHRILIWRWHFALPEPRLAIWQVVLGSVNFALVAACLHQLVSSLAQVPYVKVLAVYAIGQIAGVLSHVPGALGVLEASVLYLLPGAPSLAALVAFRVVYFFVPLLVGILVFLLSEGLRAVGLSHHSGTAD
ncbi:YbhN family protein [Nitratireductor sp. ZSWI3]|uniref:lysylphosphatidylglycerol synthase transmembrane domain-containing protein n=1 Tax=Nitratireductor sp. ZSWI3 TaxID=2966359 RepID=UPI0021503814|nr:YbhN family protein [Nitratireductor sp. ZSWI3]MCR4264703.1 UPF0104 family protein [Nitratireductor sp. ZSWI3]